MKEGKDMPILKFKAIDTERVCTISSKLVDELQELIQCPRDYFSLEVERGIYIRDGKLIEGNPVVEVSWFDRGQEVQDRSAEVITKYVQSMGYENVDVIFTALEKSRYYENGKHF